MKGLSTFLNTVNMIKTHPNSGRAAKRLGKQALLWGFVFTAGYNAIKYHQSVMEYQQNLAEVTIVPATPEENASFTQDLREFETPPEEIGMTDADGNAIEDPEERQKLWDKYREQAGLNDIKDNKELAMLEKQSDDEPLSVAYDTVYPSISDNGNDMGIDLTQYKHSKAQLDSIRAYFPIFDEYKKKYDKDYIRDVTFFTKLPDKTSGINCTKEVAIDVLGLCDQADEQKALGNKKKARELTNKATFEFIKRLEGVKRYVYLDKNNKPTVGSGICIAFEPGQKQLLTAVNNDKQRYEDIASGKSPLSDDELIRLDENTLGENGEYDRIFKNKIMASYGFNPKKFDYKKKPSHMSDQEWKAEYKKHVAKYEAIADDMINKMPTRMIGAIRAIIHHNPRSFTKLKAKDIKALNSEDPSLEAIATVIDSYNKELMKGENFTSNTLLERAFLTECVMVGDINHTMRNEAALNTIEHMTITLGNATGNALFAIVGPEITVSNEDVKDRNLHGKNILLAHSDGLGIRFSDTKEIEYTYAQTAAQRAANKRATTPKNGG